MDIKTEQINHLTKDEQSAVKLMANQATFFNTLDGAENELRAWFPL